MHLLNFKNQDDAVLDEEGEVEQCPMKESLQYQLRDFHKQMIKKVGCQPPEDAEDSLELMMEDDGSWVDKLAGFVVHVPPAPPVPDESASRRGLGKEAIPSRQPRMIFSILICVSRLL